MKIENNYIKYEIINDILIGTYKDKYIDLDIAKSVVSLRKKFTNNLKYPVLIKDNNTVKIDKSARDYFASDAGAQGINAVAVIANSVYKVTLMNFFIVVLPPKMPVKLFKSEEKAMNWLEKHKVIFHE